MLEKYVSKRNFSQTPEPKPKTIKRKKSKKFVIQFHQASHDHYDLRLEHNGVLLSWAVPKGLPNDATEKRLAIMVEDHPLSYANFHGTIPKGQYGAGVVQIFDSGSYEPLKSVGAGLKNGHLNFILHGKKIDAEFNMICLKKTENNWLIFKSGDEPRDGKIIAKESKEKTKKKKKYVANNIADDKTKESKSSKKSLDRNEKTQRDDKKKTSDKKSKKIKNTQKNAKNEPKNAKKSRKTLKNDKKIKNFTKNPFDKISPMLAKLASKIPSSDDYLFEIKYDGYRIISYIQNGKVTLKTRANNDYSAKFEQICDSLEILAKNQSAVLDGEVVCFDKNGRSDFSLLQEAIKGKKTQICYVIFDILALNGDDFRQEKLLKRKQILQKFMKNCPKNLIFSNFVIGQGKQAFDFAKQKKLEGIVAKKLDSEYSSSRNGDWLKIKCYNRQEFVIGGFTTTSKNKNLSALLLGVYDNKKLVYIGKVGTGFSDVKRKELRQLFNKNLAKKCPFECENLPKNEKIEWLKPKLVCEIQFAELTRDGMLRQPSFIDLRQDKNAKEVVMEVASDARKTDKN